MEGLLSTGPTPSSYYIYLNFSVHPITTGMIQFLGNKVFQLNSIKPINVLVYFILILCHNFVYFDPAKVTY